MQASTANRTLHLVLLLIISLAYLILTMHRTVILYDEGLILTGAQRVAHGDIPHRDFYANYGPGQFYLLAGMFKLLGSSILIERLLDTGERCICVMLVWYLSMRFTSPIAAFAAAAGSLIWLREIGFFGYPLVPATAAILANLVVLTGPRGFSSSSVRLAAAGVCLSITSLFRYDIGLMAFFVESGFMLLSRLELPRDTRSRQTARVKEAVRAPVRLALGYAAVMCPMILFFGEQRVLPDLIYDMTSAGANYVRMRSTPWPGWAAFMHNPSDFGVYLPILLSAAAIGTAMLRLKRRMPARGLALLAIMTFVTATKGMVLVMTAQMGAALIISMALAAAIYAHRSSLGRLPRFGADAVLLSAMVLTLCTVPPALHQAIWNLEWAMETAATAPADSAPQLGSCRTPPALRRAGCFVIPANIADTVLFLSKATLPNSYLFVGLARHDTLWGNDNLIYFLLDRPIATKWHHFDPGLQTTTEIQALMVDELKDRAPTIVLEDWGKVIAPNQSAVSSGVTLLDDYIRKAYIPMNVFGNITILRPNTGS